MSSEYEIDSVRRAALRFGYGARVSLRFSDRENLEALSSSMRFRPNAPLVQRRRWELAFLALTKIAEAARAYEAAPDAVSVRPLLIRASEILNAHCGACYRGDRCFSVG